MVGEPDTVSCARCSQLCEELIADGPTDTSRCPRMCCRLRRDSMTMFVRKVKVGVPVNVLRRGHRVRIDGGKDQFSQRGGRRGGCVRCIASGSERQELLIRIDRARAPADLLCVRRRQQRYRYEAVRPSETDSDRARCRFAYVKRVVRGMAGQRASLDRCPAQGAHRHTPARGGQSGGRGGGVVRRRRTGPG